MTPEQERRRQLIMAEIGALLLPIAHFAGEAQIIPRTCAPPENT